MQLRWQAGRRAVSGLGSTSCSEGYFGVMVVGRAMNREQQRVDWNDVSDRREGQQETRKVRLSGAPALKLRAAVDSLLWRLPGCGLARYLGMAP
jgi:hypothetical protein